MENFEHQLRLKPKQFGNPCTTQNTVVTEENLDEIRFRIYHLPRECVARQAWVSIATVLKATET